MPAALEGVRIIDASSVIAAPFGATLLADFGADVIKVEMPDSGDAFRGLGPFHKGEALRWAAMGRNKRCITLDLRVPAGKDVFLKLIAQSDVLIENFRTGTLDKWGLDYQTLKKANPKIIVVRVTGYGQTGPYKHLAGFGTPATAYAGLTYLQGYPDSPPVSPPFSLTDYVCGIYTALSTSMALYYRDARNGTGQEVDLSLYEGIFRMFEFLVAEYDKNGVIRERKPFMSGSSSPSGTYQTKDGKWVVLVTSTDRTFVHLAKAMDREDMLEDERFNINAARLKNHNLVDQIVGEWMRRHDYAEVKAILDKAGVPVNLINSIKDIFEDPHYRARESIIEVEHPTLGTIKMPGIVPKMTETPGRVKWAGPALGEHNREVYCGLLGLSEAELNDLKSKGAI